MEQDRPFTSLRAPLDLEPKPTQVMQRIAYRLIERDYRARPERYTYPPAGMHELSLELRPLWPSVGAFVEAAARCCASGLTLREWRDHRYKPSDRVIYKRRVPRP